MMCVLCVVCSVLHGGCGCEGGGVCVCVREGVCVVNVNAFHTSFCFFLRIL